MIKKYLKFLEAISGTMDTMPFGPGMPRPEMRNTISSEDTEMISTEDGNIYMKDQYDELYQKYLLNGGTPLPTGFNKENLEKVLAG